MKVATRIGVSLALVAALTLGLVLPTPDDLPSVALGSRELLWAERALILFYGFLLVFVPFVRGLHGQLPVELSTRQAVLKVETRLAVVDDGVIRRNTPFGQ